eukprot:COSAG02_NODE_827_length_16704_cov_8.649322_11_plen_647_part_00
MYCNCRPPAPRLSAEQGEQGEQGVGGPVIIVLQRAPMPRAAPPLEERLLPNASTQRVVGAGGQRVCWLGPDCCAVLAGVVFVVLVLVRTVMVLRAEYGMMRVSVQHPHSTIQAVAPALRFLLAVPLLVVANYAERRSAAAASLSALDQRIATREPVLVPPGPCAVPWAGILFLALIDTTASVGLSAATRAPAAADAAFVALSTGWITVPIVIGLSIIVLGRTFTRSQLVAAASAALGVALGVIPQLHRLAASGETAVGHGVGSPAAVASSVSTAVGMVGLPFGFATVYREALVGRPGSQRPAIALVRFVLSLVVWEALFSAILQAAFLPLIYASDPITLATFPAYFVNETRCLIAVSFDQESLPSDAGGTCQGVGLVFVVLAITEAAVRVAAYAMISSSSGGSFSVLSTLLWPATQLVSAWPLALGKAVAAPGWHFCRTGYKDPEYPCLTPLGPFFVSSLAVCVVAVAIWCNITHRWRQHEEAVESGVVSPSSSSSHAVVVTHSDDGGIPEEDATFDEIVHEVVGLHRQGVYILVMLIVLALAVFVGMTVGWVGQVVHALGCLFRAADNRCNQRELAQSCVLALLPLSLLASALLLRWQSNRRGLRRRQEACRAAGAVPVTLHVYGPFPQSASVRAVAVGAHAHSS